MSSDQLTRSSGTDSAVHFNPAVVAAVLALAVALLVVICAGSHLGDPHGRADNAVLSPLDTPEGRDGAPPAVTEVEPELKDAREVERRNGKGQ